MAGTRPGSGQPYIRHHHGQPVFTSVEETGYELRLQSLCLESVQTDNLPSIYTQESLSTIQNDNHLQSNSGFSDVGNIPRNGHVQPFVKPEIQDPPRGATHSPGVADDVTTTGASMLLMQTASGPVHGPSRLISSGPTMTEHTVFPYQNTRRVLEPPQIQQMRDPTPLEFPTAQRFETVGNQLILENQNPPETIEQIVDTYEWPLQQQHVGTTNGLAIADNVTPTGARMIHVPSGSVHDPSIQIYSRPTITEHTRFPYQNTQRVSEPPLTQQMLDPTPLEIATAQRYEAVKKQLIQENQILPETIEQFVATHGNQCLHSRATFFGLMDDERNQTNESQDISWPRTESSKSSISGSSSDYSRTFTTAQTSFDSTRYPSAEYTPNHVISTTQSRLQHRDDEAIHMEYPEYVKLFIRLKSFESWPRRYPTPQSMANAGFFYSGKSDLCRCFCCGNGWSLWDETDDPFKEHLKNEHTCSFIRSLSTRRMHMANGGQTVRTHMTYSQQLEGMQRTNGGNGPVVTTGQHGPRRFDPLVCKVCHKNMIGVAQHPCAHMICLDCVRHNGSGYLDCRICGKTVRNVIPYDISQLGKKA